MIRLYTILNDELKYKKLLMSVKMYNPENYNRYHQIKVSVRNPQYSRGYRIPNSNTMMSIASDYKKCFLDTRTRKEIAMWLLEPITNE